MFPHDISISEAHTNEIRSKQHQNTKSQDIDHLPDSSCHFRHNL